MSPETTESQLKQKEHPFTAILPEQAEAFFLVFGPKGVTNVTVQKFEASGNHQNFIVQTKEGKRLVLRLRGPEKGKTKQGIVDEYRILEWLQKTSKKRLGPSVFSLDEAFFKQPAIVMEYLDGALLSELADKEFGNRLEDIATLLAQISLLPTKTKIPFQIPHFISYQIHINTAHQRLNEISASDMFRESDECKKLHNNISSLLPQAREMFITFESPLKKALHKLGEWFILESASVGHFIATTNGLRAINWEQVNRGDPSFTLARFLSSIKNREKFPELKTKLTDLFLQRVGRHLKSFHPESFKTLIEYRLAEREISNLVWVLWEWSLHAKEKGEKRTVAQVVEKRFHIVTSLLKNPPH